MKFLGGFFERKAAAKGDAIARATGGSNVARAGSYMVPGRWDIEQAIHDGYERVMMVFRCTDAIASAQADIPIVVRRGDVYDGKVVEYKDIDRLLNRRPNSYEDAWMFRYRLSSQLLLSRRGAFIEIIPSNSGGLAELHLLPPGQVEPIPDPKKFVSGYKVRRADFEEDVLEPERVIWIRSKPHPTDPYAQMTPLVAAGLSADTDYLARMFNRTFLVNDGRPGLLVGIRGNLSPQDAQEIKRRFSGGVQQAGQTTVVESDGIDVEDLAANPRDVQWQEAINGSKEDIMVAFGVPESVLGNASGRTFDNADAEFEIFYVVTVKGHCNSIARPLDVLTGDINDDDMIAYDYSKVEVLQRAEHKRRDTSATRFSQGLGTLDDYLKESGQQELNVPASRVYFLPNGIVAAKDEKDMEVVSGLPIIGVQPTPNNEEQARRGALRGTQQGQRTFENIIAARALRLAKHNNVKPETKSIELKVRQHPYLQQRTQLEGYIEGALSHWSDRQEQVVVERLSHTKCRKGTRHWDGEQQSVELKAIDPTYVVEMEKWSNEVRASLEQFLRKTARYEANRVARDLQSSGVLDAILASGEGNPEGKTSLERLIGGGSMDSTAMIDTNLVPVLDIIEKAASRQSQRVVQTIKEMDADGASLSEIKREVRKMMSTRSSWHKSLAVNITTATVEGVRASVYGQAGNLVVKTWNSTDDEKTRESHIFADQQSRPANRSFKVGMSNMMFPGDPRAPIEETANCRCWLDYRVSKKAMSNRTKKTASLTLERN